MQSVSVSPLEGPGNEMAPMQRRRRETLQVQDRTGFGLTLEGTDGERGLELGTGSGGETNPPPLGSVSKPASPRLLILLGSFGLWLLIGPNHDL